MPSAGELELDMGYGAELLGKLDEEGRPLEEPVPVGPVVTVELGNGNGTVSLLVGSLVDGVGGIVVVRIGPLGALVPDPTGAEVVLDRGKGAEVPEPDEINEDSVEELDMVAPVPVGEGELVGPVLSVVFDRGNGAELDPGVPVENPPDEEGGGTPEVRLGAVPVGPGTIVEFENGKGAEVSGTLVGDVVPVEMPDEGLDVVIPVPEMGLVPVGPVANVELERGKGAELPATLEVTGRPVPELGRAEDAEPVVEATVLPFVKGKGAELETAPDAWVVGAVTRLEDGNPVVGTIVALELERGKGALVDGKPVPVEGVTPLEGPDPVVGPPIVLEFETGKGALLNGIPELLVGALVPDVMVIPVGEPDVPVGPFTPVELEIGKGALDDTPVLGSPPVPVGNDVPLEGPEVPGIPGDDVTFDVGNGGIIVEGMMDPLSDVPLLVVVSGMVEDSPVCPGEVPVPVPLGPTVTDELLIGKGGVVVRVPGAVEVPPVVKGRLEVGPPSVDEFETWNGAED